MTERTLCRFVSDPFPECHCLNLTARGVARMVALCAADYRSCAIYRQRTALPATPDPGPSRQASELAPVDPEQKG